MKIPALVFLLFGATTGLVGAGPRLLIDTPNPQVAEGKQVILNLSLRNDGNKSVSVPPLRFATVKWSVTDETGRRLDRGGQLRLISDHGTPDMVVPAGTVVRNQMRLDIKARQGDKVNVTAYLGKRAPLVSNTLTVFCLSRRK